MVAGPSPDNASPVFLLPTSSSFGQASGWRSQQPLWDQREVTLRVLELSVRSMSVPLAQISLEIPSLDLHRMLVEANMMMMGAAASNAVSAANNVNATLGSAIQQLRVSVDTLKQTVNDVCAIAHRDRVDLNRLYKAVANLDNVLGGAKLTASSVELTPLALQLDDAAASIKASESGVEAEQLAGRLVKAAMSKHTTSAIHLSFLHASVYLYDNVTGLGINCQQCLLLCCITASCHQPSLSIARHYLGIACHMYSL